MARNGNRAILVIGRLLKTKTSVRTWGEYGDDDATEVQRKDESVGCGPYNQGYSGIRARNQPLWVDESFFCAYAESKSKRMGVQRSGHSYGMSGTKKGKVDDMIGRSTKNPHPS
jgi:hypothetical protein